MPQRDKGTKKMHPKDTLVSAWACVAEAGMHFCLMPSYSSYSVLSVQVGAGLCSLGILLSLPEPRQLFSLLGV